ncbi:MAG: PTS sugar transporter subunit IIA [Planctomycetaceae bacterium]
MRALKKALQDEALLLDLDADDLGSILHAALEIVVAGGWLAADDRDRVEAALLEREEQVSTAIGHAVAVPHAYLDCFEHQVVVFVRLKDSLNLGAPDGIATRFLFILLGPAGAASEHLDTLTVIARLMSDEQFRYDAAVGSDSRQLLAALDRFNARTMPAAAPAIPELEQGLQFSGRPFGGMIADVQRRFPHFAADFRDGFHPKCLSSILFLFFACLAPAVTFGGVMATMTGEQIGPVEMIVASAACGVVYALISGQPLIILGGTGPLLVFTALSYQLCEEYGIPFLPTYAWVGLWSALFVMLLAATDASALMRYFTRFTDEIFAALISIIFIYEAVKSLLGGFENLEQTQNHDTAFFSLVLALGTYYIAMNLSRMRRSRFLQPLMREFLADFGPTIALVAMTLLAVLFREVTLNPLPSPDTFGTTNGRPWSVDLWETPVWARWAAIGPALLVAVLVFLDQQITARLINSPDHKLKRGTAYHLDLAVVGGMIGACSLFGLPWLVAATVRSLNHVRSLATTEEAVSGRGDAREQILHVRENRLTAFAIHLLIGLSLLALPVLKAIPMAVLYGIFLFMGVVSMVGNQFFDRLSLWAMDRNLYPSTHYIRMVPNRIIHTFTLVQLLCLAVLWIVKASPKWGILFPLFIALLVPVRLLLGRYFKPEHLAALDAEEEPDEEGTHWSV